MQFFYFYFHFTISNFEDKESIRRLESINYRLSSCLIIKVEIPVTFQKILYKGIGVYDHIEPIFFQKYFFELTIFF